MRTRHAPALLCYALALCQLGWTAGCGDSISGSGGGGGQSSTVAGVLASQDIGAIVFDVYRGQLAAEPQGAPRDARLAALDARRADFIDAINDIVNVRTLQGVAATADAVYALVDDGTLPLLSRHVAAAIDLLLQDAQAQDALVQLLGSPAARTPLPPSVLLELLGRMFNYPETEQLWTATAQLVAENDGVDANGQPNGEPTLVKDLLAFGSDALRRAGAAQPGPTASRLLSALQPVGKSLVEPATVRGTFDLGPPAWVARVDDRGLPRVAVDPATGRLFAPFEDANGDGLADADAQGRFVDRAGAVIDRPAFGKPGAPGFDQDGRAVVGAGVPLYVFVDAKKTVLGLHLQVAGELLAKDLDQHGLAVLLAALGPRQADGSYGRDNPVIDLGWGMMGMLEPDASPKALRAASSLLKRDPAMAERIAVAMARAHDALKRTATRSSFAASRLSDPRVVQLVDDLMPLCDDLLEAPTTRAGRSTGQVVMDTFAQLKGRAPDFGAQLAPLLIYKRVEREATPDADRNGIDEARSARVDFAQLPAGDNRSAIHQLLDLLARADSCQLFGKSMAVWTIELMAGLSPQTVGSLASLLQNLPGFLTNLFCSGISNDIAALDALAKSGALDGLLPLAKAFVDQGEAELLVKLLVRTQRSYSQTVRGIEPDVAEFLAQGALDELQTLLELAQQVRDPVTNATVSDCMAEMLGQLVDDDATLLDRAGQRVPTRAHLLLRPVVALDRRVVAANAQADLTALADGLFAVVMARETVNGAEVLKNGSLIPLVGKVLESLEQSVPADPAQRRADVAQARTALVDALASKDLGTVIQLVQTIERSPSKTLIRRGIVNLLTANRTAAHDIFGSVARCLVLLLQAPTGTLSTSTFQALAPFLAKVVDPANPLVPDVIKAFEHMLTADQGKTVLNVLRAALNPAPGEVDSPAAVLLGIVQEVQAAGGNNGGQALDRATLAKNLQGVSTFIRDDKAGLAYIFELIRNRQR